MTHERPRTNESGQPIGADLGNWKPPSSPPPHQPIEGSWARLEPWSADTHAQALFDSYLGAPETLWTYLAWGPYDNVDQLTELVDLFDSRPDCQVYVVVVTDRPVGMLSFLRTAPNEGSIEIGAVAFSPLLQRTTASSEAVMILIRHAIDHGYRRVEWKCDSLNGPSRAAALRLGFIYEGTFKKATHYRGRSRDTAWFAITDDEWPTVDAAHREWLDPANFDVHGSQLRPLAVPPAADRRLLTR